MKVVNTIGDLRQKVLNKFGFKRMWMEKHGKYTEIWAKFNPKILFMLLEELKKTDPKRYAEYEQINKNIAENVEGRTTTIDKRNQQLEGTDDYNALNQEVRSHSEKIGEGSVDAHMKAKGYNTKHEGSGAYNLDRVYEKDGIFYVVEAKGGGGGLGGKNAFDIDGNEVFAQQGTKEYLEETIGDLRNKNTELSRQLERANRRGNVKYLHGQQKINTDGSLGEFIMKEFDI